MDVLSRFVGATQEVGLFYTVLLVVLAHVTVAGGLLALASLLHRKNALEFQLLASFCYYLSCVLIATYDFHAISFYMFVVSGTLMLCAALIRMLGNYKIALTEGEHNE